MTPIRATAEELRLLPKHAREVLQHLYDGKHYDQIADAVGLPVGTVKSRISRARARVLAIRAAAKEKTKAVTS